MAFASVGSFGTANSTTSNTTLALTPTVTLEVGNLAMLVIAYDSIAVNTSPVAEFGHKISNVSSVTDSGSNTWHKLGEVGGNQAAAGGSNVCLYYSIITTQLTTSSTVTITFGSAITSKAASGWEFTIGGSALAVERIRFRATAATDPPSMTLDDLPSREYLFFRARASETDSTSWTNTTNFTPITNAVADAGAAAAGASADGEFRIITSTSQTSDPTKSAVDGADIFIALWEGAQSSSSPWVVTGNTLQAGQVAQTVPWPLGHETDDIALLVCESANGETVSLTTANGFAEVSSSPQDASNTKLSIFWCRATSSSMSSPVTNDPGDHINTHMYLVRGCHNSGNPWNAMTGNTGTSSTSVTIPEVTTTLDRCLILWVCSQGSDVSTDEFSSWSNSGSTRFEELDSISTTAGNGGGHGIAYGYKATAGATGTATATLVTASGQGRITIALKPQITGTQFNQSVDGGVTPSGAIFKDGRKPLAGTLTTSGTAVKLTSKAFSGAISTIAGLLEKQINKPLSGDLSSIVGTLLTSMIFGKILSGDISSISGSLTKQGQKTLSGSDTPSGSISKNTNKSLSGDVSSIVGTLSKQTNKIFSGALSSIVGAINASKISLISLGGTLSSSGDIIKQTAKTLFADLTSSGNIAKQTNKQFSGILTSAGSIIKSIGKFLSGILPSAGDLVTQYIPAGQTFFKDLSGTLASSGIVQKLSSISFSGNLTSSGTLIKSTIKFLSGILSSQGTLIKSTLKSISGNIIPSGEISKLTSKFVGGTLSLSGILESTRAYLLSLGGNLILSGTINKNTQKDLAGTLTSSSSISKLINKLTSGSLISSGTVTRVSAFFRGIISQISISDVLNRFLNVEALRKYIYLLGSKILNVQLLGRRNKDVVFTGEKDDTIDLVGKTDKP